jgi:NAD(P)-dependent dehydrogenase (short-subunit alcohol dehydrogenase family)
MNTETLAGKVAVTPLRRVGQPKDIAPSAVFSLPPIPTGSTGETLLIAGGLR